MKERTGRKKFTKTIYNFDFNIYTYERVYKIYNEYEVEYEDEYGRFWETEWEYKLTVTISNERFEREFDSSSDKLKDYIEKVYNAVEW